MADKLAELLEDTCEENFMKYIKRYIGNDIRTGERHTKNKRFDQLIVSKERFEASEKDLEEEE